MGSRELVEGLLWRTRAGIRGTGIALRAGHGMADAAYRPAALPYASVVGPLNIELEPERDPPRSIYLPVQEPGYLAGAPLSPAENVPAAGELRLLLDGDVALVADVDFGPLTGQPVTNGGVGVRVARVLERAVHDADARAAGVTTRWDRVRQRVVIASGRRGPVSGIELQDRGPSSVTLDDVTAVATALGLDGFEGRPAVIAPGRVARHRRPTPTSVAVDVRVDLWSGSQSELAAVLDAWTRTTATRGQLLLRPAVLAEDVHQGDTSVRLLAPAEPMVRTTIAMLDVIAPLLVDRQTGHLAQVIGAGVTVADGEVSLGGAQRVELDFFELPPLPAAWTPEIPTVNGYSATIGLRTTPGAGGVVRVLTVVGPGVDGDAGQGRTALRLDVSFAAGAAELRATAMRADAGDFASATAPVGLADLAAGVDVHVTLDVRRGALQLAVNGQLVADGGLSPAGPPVGAAPMRMILGAPDGAAPNPATVHVRHVHLHGAPVGPPDPRLRLAAAPASAWSPGDPFVLARSYDGVTTVGDGVAASVLGVQGDRVLLDRPIPSAFPRAASIAYRRSEFFSQRSLRRSDDLMNQLYRMSAEYRVSTVLDEPDSVISAPLVETVDLQVRELGVRAAELEAPGEPVFVGRPAHGRPGITAIFTKHPPRSTKTPPESEPASEPTEEPHG